MMDSDEAAALAQRLADEGYNQLMEQLESEGVTAGLLICVMPMQLGPDGFTSNRLAVCTNTLGTAGIVGAPPDVPAHVWAARRSAGDFMLKALARIQEEPE